METEPGRLSERSYNGLRLALALAKEKEAEIFVFLIGDTASCAGSGQTTPQGYYNLERMLKGVTSRGGTVGGCAAAAWMPGGSRRIDWRLEQ